MSFRSSIVRSIRPNECELIRFLSNLSEPKWQPREEIDALNVVELKDGGMGSVRIVRNGTSQKKQSIPTAAGLFMDIDGVRISVQLNCNETEELDEIDIWKTDFSPVIRYPSPASFISIQRVKS